MFLQKCLDLIYFLAGRSENNPSKCTQNRWARVSSMFRLSRPDGGSANDYCRHRRSVICQSQWLILKVSRLFLFSTNSNYWLKTGNLISGALTTNQCFVYLRWLVKIQIHTSHYFFFKRYIYQFPDDLFVQLRSEGRQLLKRPLVHQSRSICFSKQ